MGLRFGLIGKTLKHSFSREYFQSKFEKQNLDHSYHLFEVNTIDQLNEILNTQQLRGLNVTIPYKEEVISFCDELDHSAKKIGAVNVLKISDNKVIGYNSDYYGFKESLANWIKNTQNIKALVLGTGGAAKAVCVALDDLSIHYKAVSRSALKGEITYKQLATTNDFKESQLIINTTPLGMFPNNERKPELPYELLNPGYYLYDLVYNPEETAFMKKGLEKGAHVKNGLEMLELQAERSWQIWTT